MMNLLENLVTLNEHITLQILQLLRRYFETFHIQVKSICMSGVRRNTLPMRLVQNEDP